MTKEEREKLIAELTELVRTASDDDLRTIYIFAITLI